MRITGPNGPAAATNKSSVRRTSSSGFTLPTAEETAAPSGTSGVATLSGIEALLALQGVDSATDRRRRALGRGRTALDTLDEVKIAFLSGPLDSAAADRLRASLVGLTESSGDPGLDRVLAEIELRVEVELAKMDAASA